MSFASLYSKTTSARALKRTRGLVRQINAQESWAQGLSDYSLSALFQALSTRPLEQRTVPGFALVREACRRTLGLRMFDVQIIGGLTLLKGKLAEMRTGEGKTLTLVAPAALQALDAKGVHVVTANSYLATRDSALMAPVYAALGLTAAAVSESQPLAEKQAAYAADVTYGVGHEFGFDYLKDNLVRHASDKCQRPLYAAIVDEIDSILIDEARVPLLISAQAPDASVAVRVIDCAVAELSAGVDFEVVLKEQQASLTESGYAKVEQYLADKGLIATPRALYEPKNLVLVRRIHAAVKAYALFRLDRDYVVHNGELVLVDQGTGRKMVGRRFDDGLHEALEAKEHIQILPGTLTRATITYQSFFALYHRLSGLTGTAMTEAEEFSEMYRLETVAVPTNRPILRQELGDIVFLTKSEKFNAVAAEVQERHSAGQPVLVGCATIRDAEVVSKLLSQRQVVHEVLTAKYLEREAHIIAQAGRRGAVTVATNMAGRGTDILLGGEKPTRDAHTDDAAFAQAVREWEAERAAVLASNGLFVLGTERNGIRRVDNQLAGRCGRQGDPGQVQFYLSLEDELLRVFGTNRKLALLRRLVAASNGALQGNHVKAMVTASQRKYENQGFDARKNLLAFDRVLGEQRKTVFALRDHLLAEGGLSFCSGAVITAVQTWCASQLDAAVMPEQWDLAAAKHDLQLQFGVSAPLVGWVHKENLNADEVHEKVVTAVRERFESKELSGTQCAEAVFAVLGELWTEHLTALDELGHAVGLNKHSGLNPMFQFHNDAYKLFNRFEEAMNFEVAVQLLEDQPDTKPQPAAAISLQAAGNARVAAATELRWVTRNEACPCGSLLRFKSCHGKLAAP